jgi:ribulose-phosphate 3-epimerase
MKPASNWFATLPRHRLMAEYSLWSADLMRLAEDMARVEQHVDLFHIDVSDGRFSPAFLFFPDLVAFCRKHTTKPFHIHLMTCDDVVMGQIDQFAEAGADVISLHVENGNAAEGIARIKQHGLHAGLVLRVETPVADISRFVDDISFVTLLGTQIGVKGQGLDAAAGARLSEVRKIIAARKRADNLILAADGGIRENTVPLLAGAGAQTVVMGSLAFNAPDLGVRMAWVHAQALAP